MVLEVRNWVKKRLPWNDTENRTHCLLIHVVQQLVKILEPFPCVLVLEVGAHREHDVIGRIFTGLCDGSSVECCNTFVDVVVK